MWINRKRWKATLERIEKLESALNIAVTYRDSCPIYDFKRRVYIGIQEAISIRQAIEAILDYLEVKLDCRDIKRTVTVRKATLERKEKNETV